MRRKRVTGRFYVFLGLLLVGGYFILREILPDATQEAVVTMANATYSYTVDAVIVRDEVVSSYEGEGRVVYLASEGEQVNEGSGICEVYSAGYSERELTKLETVRQSIRSYHEQILDNIVDTELDRLEQKVEDLALQLKTLITNKSGGSLLNLEKQLESAMNERQEYLRANQRQDQKLNQLYDEETKRMNAISSWRTVAAAPRAGVVSFYLDGYESYLNVDNVSSITSADVRNVLAGRALARGASSRLMTDIFRVVSTDRWYIALLSGDVNWNPIAGQVLTFQLEGYSDVAYSGSVVSVQKTTSEVLAVLEVSGTPGPLLSVRSGKADIGVYLSSLSVPVGALSEQAGQSGVWLSDAAGGSFIPVEILYRDSRYALVQPLAEGTLSVGQRVLIR